MIRFSHSKTLATVAIAVGTAVYGLSACSAPQSTQQSTPQVTGSANAPIARLNQIVASSIVRPAAKPPAPKPVLAPSQEVGVTSQEAVALLVEINRERRARGLRPLRADARLMSAASDYARVSAHRRHIDHTGPDGSSIGQRVTRAGYVWAFVSENLAAGQDVPRETVVGWLNSPGHRRNLLDPEPIDVGTGFFNDPSDKRFGNYWVMLAGSPRAL